MKIYIKFLNFSQYWEITEYYKRQFGISFFQYVREITQVDLGEIVDNLAMKVILILILVMAVTMTLKIICHLKPPLHRDYSQAAVDKMALRKKRTFKCQIIHRKWQRKRRLRMLTPDFDQNDINVPPTKIAKIFS